MLNFWFNLWIETYFVARKIESVWNTSALCFPLQQHEKFVCLLVLCRVRVCVVYSILFVHPCCMPVYFSVFKKLILFGWRRRKTQASTLLSSCWLPSAHIYEVWFNKIGPKKSTVSNKCMFRFEFINWSKTSTAQTYKQKNVTQSEWASPF